MQGDYINVELDFKNMSDNAQALASIDRLTDEIKKIAQGNTLEEQKSAFIAVSNGKGIVQRYGQGTTINLITMLFMEVLRLAQNNDDPNQSKKMLHCILIITQMEISKYN